MGYELSTYSLTNEATAVPEAMERLEDLVQQCKEANMAIERATWRMTKMCNIKWKLYHKGDLVWLDARNINDPTLPAKLKLRRYGPFVVEAVHFKLAYHLKLPKQWKIHPVFHADLLMPYQTNQWYGHAQPAPESEEIEGQQEYKVDKILNIR